MLRVFILAVFASVLALVLVEPAFAGPGGRIASAAFETTGGRIVLGILTVVFLPMIIYIYLREALAERRARKDLRFMAGYSSQFEWLQIMERAKDCFTRVHSGWEKEDLTDVSSWMTDWYWQNQQMVYLDKWKRDGLANICNLKKITHIKPLLFVHRNQGAEHEHSMVVISIAANMNDFLQKRSTGEIVEGSTNYKEVETIWSFVLENGAWKVSNIEEGGMSLAYAKMIGELPRIETTVLGRSKV